MPRQRHTGFTLVEVLIAIALFAILSVLAYGGLESVIQTRTHTSDTLQRLHQLQNTVSKLQRDLEQVSARPARDELGGILQPLSAVVNDELLIQLTRSGRPNPANLPRSHLQRVAYRLEEDTLIRMTWPHVDRAQDAQAIETELLPNLEEVRLRFLDDTNQWHDNWPPANVLPGEAVDMPLAVEITLQMNDWGDIVRLFRVNQ